MDDESHTSRLVRRIREIRRGDPPEPWKRLPAWAIGGLYGVGYASDSDLLLVISSQGRGVFDCLKGEKIARDPSAEDLPWCDPQHLTCEGIGLLENQSIRFAGIWGGGLPRMTSDGWSLDLVSPDWPLSSVVLSPPGSYVHHESAVEHCVRVAPKCGDDDIITYGFSETGKSFIVAMSHTLEIFARP